MPKPTHPVLSAFALVTLLMSLYALATLSSAPGAPTLWSRLTLAGFAAQGLVAAGYLARRLIQGTSLLRKH